MIKFIDDTVFNAPAEWIVNTVNCVGVMGKGLALEFALRYPKLEEIYKNQCANKEINLGNIYNYEIEGTKIINFPTKYHFKYPSQYEWIERGLKDFCLKYKKLNIKSVAFPYLGCTNGELDYQVVRMMMTKYLSLEDVDVYICSSKLVAGKEKEMLENFKSTPIEELFSICKLNNSQKEELKKNRAKISRFYEILNIPKIGISSYKKYFDYFYNLDKKNNVAEQLFFDLDN